MKKVLLFIALFCSLSVFAGNGIVSYLDFTVSIINGGAITNASLDMKVGSLLKILNNGMMVCRTDVGFQAPIGAVVNISNGKICNSNDF